MKRGEIQIRKKLLSSQMTLCALALLAVTDCVESCGKWKLIRNFAKKYFESGVSCVGIPCHQSLQIPSEKCAVEVIFHLRGI